MRWSDLEEDGAFDAFMGSIDVRLKAAGVDIASRPLRAFAIIATELKVRVMMGGAMSQRVNGWFMRRYGDRLKIDWSPGQMLVDVRGDPYVVKYPLIYGTVAVNLLGWIDKATPALFETFSHGELERLAGIIKTGFDAFLRMSALPPLLLSDLSSAVQQLMKRPPDPGLSKWSSQQAVEKVLTGFIRQRLPTYKRPKGGSHLHDLRPLVRDAEGLGLPPVDRAIIEVVDCEAGARYAGRVPVSVSDAIHANQVAVTLCGEVAASWQAPSTATPEPRGSSR